MGVTSCCCPLHLQTLVYRQWWASAGPLLLWSALWTAPPEKHQHSHIQPTSYMNPSCCSILIFFCISEYSTLENTIWQHDCAHTHRTTWNYVTLSSPTQGADGTSLQCKFTHTACWEIRRYQYLLVVCVRSQSQTLPSSKQQIFRAAMDEYHFLNIQGTDDIINCYFTVKLILQLT